MRIAASRRLRVVLAVVVVVGVGAGAAWALMPGSAGPIHACFKNATGALRAVDDPAACGPSETPIDLGGPTKGFAVSDAGDAALGTSSTSILKLGLPAGKYLLHAKTNLFNLPGSDAVFVPCDLRLAGTTTELDATRVVLEEHVTGSEASEADIPLQAALTLSEPAVVQFECAALTRGTSSSVVARYRQLDAVSLDTLN